MCTHRGSFLQPEPQCVGSARPVRGPYKPPSPRARPRPGSRPAHLLPAAVAAWRGGAAVGSWAAGLLLQSAIAALPRPPAPPRIHLLWHALSPVLGSLKRTVLPLSSRVQDKENFSLSHYLSTYLTSLFNQSNLDCVLPRGGGGGVAVDHPSLAFTVQAFHFRRLSFRPMTLPMKLGFRFY
jgi:hypothetical protein